MGLVVAKIAYTGWMDGKCCYVAIKFSGPYANTRNAETVSEMVREGYEIREMPIPEARAAYIESNLVDGG